MLNIQEMLLAKDPSLTSPRVKLQKLLSNPLVKFSNPETHFEVINVTDAETWAGSLSEATNTDFWADKIFGSGKIVIRQKWNSNMVTNRELATFSPDEFLFGSSINPNQSAYATQAELIKEGSFPSLVKANLLFLLTAHFRHGALGNETYTKWSRVDRETRAMMRQKPDELRAYLGHNVGEELFTLGREKDLSSIHRMTLQPGQLLVTSVLHGSAYNLNAILRDIFFAAITDPDIGQLQLLAADDIGVKEILTSPGVIEVIPSSVHGRENDRTLFKTLLKNNFANKDLKNQYSQTNVVIAVRETIKTMAALN